MAMFSDITNSEYAAKDIAKIRESRGESRHTPLGALLSQTVPSLFMYGLDFISAKESADSSSDSEDDVLSAEHDIEELNSNLEALGVGKIDDKTTTIISDVNSKIEDIEKNADEVRTNVNKNIVQFKHDIGLSEQSILDLTKKLEDKSLTQSEKNQISEQIKALEEGIKKTEASISEEEVKLAKAKDVLKKCEDVRNLARKIDNNVSLNPESCKDFDSIIDEIKTNTDPNKHEELLKQLDVAYKKLGDNESVSRRKAYNLAKSKNLSSNSKSFGV